MSGATVKRAYRPGSWFGIFGDRATVLLPPSEKARVSRLWELVDDGAGFDEVLDALIARGLRDLPGFVLISEVGPETKVVIRGDAGATFVSEGEQVDLEGSAGTTWVERTLPAVSSVTVDLGDPDGAPHHDASAPDLTIGNGLVRVGRLQAPPPDDTAATPPDDTDDTDDTPAVDHDGLTSAGTSFAAPLDRRPGIPGQPPAPGVVSRPVARLLISTGDTVDVDRAVVIGRAPQARRFPADEQPRLVPVPSPAQEISSTHLEVRPGSGVDHGSAVATDLGSTNGTVVVQPGLPPEDLRAGIAVQLIPGAIIDLGDGVTIQVVNP